MHLKSNLPALDELFSESFTPGKIIEWGLPQGQNSRILPLLFLRGSIPATAWIYSQQNHDIYPPSWSCLGVHLNRIFFICSNEPVKQLRPLFLENTFKVLIIDSPKKFSKGDLNFVTQKIRENGQILFLIRNYLLSSKLGNPFAKLRVNCTQDKKNHYCIQFVKGKSLKKIYFPSKRIFNE